jgi:uncharacterized protein YkwD
MTLIGIPRCWLAVLLPVFFAAALFATSARGQSIDEDFSESLSRNQIGEAAARGEPVDAAEVVRRIVEQTNAFREAEGFSPVSTNPQLTETARYFADYMARTDRYGHTADGQRPADRARDHEYAFCIVSENIAYQFSSRPFSAAELARRFVEGWKESPEHRRNMLDADLTETGVAVAQSDETDHYYAVQMFGRPESARIELRIENTSDREVEYELAEQRFSLPPRYVRSHQRCRPADLLFHLPEAIADEAQQRVRVDSDAQFVVANDGVRRGP